MPNGHGGYVRYFSVVVLLIVAAGLLVYARKTDEAWAVYGGYALGALIGERLAHHLHRWKYDEYGGAYYSEETHAAVRKLYIVCAILYAIGGVVAWYFLTHP
jgi:YD repeat-containing protein